MSHQIISKKKAKEILNSFVDLMSSTLNEHIKAIILVGSLSNGSFTGMPGSDIDQITILKEDVVNGIRDLVISNIKDIERNYNNIILISKTVYNLKELQRPFNTNIKLDSPAKSTVNI
jgi:hypothetical protein